MSSSPWLDDDNPGVSGALSLRVLVEPHVDSALGLSHSVELGEKVGGNSRERKAKASRMDLGTLS